MQELDLKKLHDKTYELAKEFHQICRTHHLRYYMIGGTMLGAFREKDFIPWDDDMDIAMPRRDYDKLMKIRNEVRTDILSIEYPDKDSFPWGYARVFHRGTTLIQGAFNYPGGVFIDLYPLDNAGENMFTRYIYTTVYKIYDGLKLKAASSDRYHVARGRLIDNYAASKGSLYWINRKESFFRKLAKRRPKYLANYYGIYMDKEIMPAEVFGKPVLYRFRDTKFYGVANPDYYLTRLYGKNYMTPPPPNARKNTRHSCKYVNFEESYEKFRRK